METAEKELTLEEAFLRLEEVTRALEDEKYLSGGVLCRIPEGNGAFEIL